MIQYSGGTYVNSTFAGTSKALIITGLQTLLTNAGWTVVSGGGTTNLLMQTAVAAGSNNQGRVRFIDNGGTGIQIILENVSGSVKQAQSTNTGGTLIPGPTYQVLATRYQFFCFPSTGTVLPRQFVCAGILFVPLFLQGVVTEALYMASNAVNDGDSSDVASSFRTALSQIGNSATNRPGNHSTVVNGNLYDHSNDQFQHLADLVTIVPLNSFGYTYANSAFIPGNRWHDFSLQISEVLVAYGNTSSSDEALIRGQLFDVCFVSDVFPQNATTSFPDGGATHGFFSLSSQANYVRGSLLVATS